jgi:hypothetical protein
LSRLALSELTACMTTGFCFLYTYSSLIVSFFVFLSYSSR